MADDADARLKILIEYGLDEEAAKQAIANIDEIGKATKEAGEHTKGHNTHAREMRMLFGQIDRIAPGMGKALKAALHPEMIGILGAIVALKYLIHGFEELKKKAEEAAQATAGIWIAQREEIEKAAQTMEDYQASLAKVTATTTERFAVQKALLEGTLVLLRQMPGFHEGEAFAGGRKVVEGQLGAVEAQLDAQRKKTAALTLAAAEGSGGGLGAPGAPQGVVGTLKAAEQLLKRTPLEKLKEEAVKAGVTERDIPTLKARAEELGRLSLRGFAGTAEAKTQVESLLEVAQKLEDGIKADAMIKAHEKTATELKKSQDETVRLTGEMERLKTELRTFKISEANKMIGELEKATGTTDPRSMLQRIYPNMGKMQLDMYTASLTHVTDVTEGLLQSIVKFVTTHQKQIEEMKKQLDRTGR